MTINVKSNGYSMHEKLLRERISQRITAEFCDGGLTIELAVDESLGKKESYSISKVADGYLIKGSDELGLYYGIGKLLRAAKWREDGFEAYATDGVISPACDYRAIFYSMHFFNWYHVAPIEEQESYLCDLLLWGYNTIHCTLPRVNIYDLEDEIFKKAMKNVRRIFALAKSIGMKTSLSLGSNQGMKGTPHEYDAEMSFDLELRGNLGRNLCISKPGVLDYLRGIWRDELNMLSDIGLDYVTCWPYDEGGCGCEKCRPWGANGYLNMCRAARDTAREIFPNIEVVVGTWAFDAPNDEGEYEGLYRRLKGDMAWIDYLMVDAHGDFPRYPLEHEVIRPIVNFPEISMWGLAPWGGFGANPLPERFQRIWDSSKHIISGGLPYSEGISEDISKIQWIGYYFDPEKHYSEILAEYIRYEYGEDLVDEALELMRLIEINHTHIGNGEYPELDVAERALAIAESINARLSERAKTSWRWRILYIRARLDAKRYAALLADTSDDPKKLKRFTFYSGDLLLEDAEAQDMFLELQKYYHCLPHNGENHHTLPPYGGTKLDVVV